MYYCIYRYVLKTPPWTRSADALPGVFLAWTLSIHGLVILWIFTLAANLRPHPLAKPIGVAVLVLLLALFCWHYVWKENSTRVIRVFEKRGDHAKYARIGAIMWYESLLILFIVGGLLILSQKLTGWPPHP